MRRPSWPLSAGAPGRPPPSVYVAEISPKTFASSPWPASPVVWIVPRQPVASVIGCECSSCPSRYWTRIREQAAWSPETVPSSLSVAVTSNGIASPKSKKPPSSGELISTAGAALPTTTVTSSVPARPVLSVTVSVAR